ncbi:hypothetical protein J6590_088075 [Homalodisca vitripennis]|nr:hypothetical protein J6590_088075 [Homalodisca vitripennis]
MQRHSSDHYQRGADIPAQLQSRGSGIPRLGRQPLSQPSGAYNPVDGITARLNSIFLRCQFQRSRQR